MDKKEKKRGFSGLSDLASDVGRGDEVINPASTCLTSGTVKTTPRTNANDKTERKDSGTSQPMETFGGDKKEGVSVGKIILGISAIIFLIWGINNEFQKTKKTSHSSPPSSQTYTLPKPGTEPAYQSRHSSPRPRRSTLSRPQSHRNSSALSGLAMEIENGRTRLKQMKAKIEDMDSEIDDYKRRMKSYMDFNMTDEYNQLIPSFNSLIRERNDLVEKARSLVDEINSRIKRYNSENR